MKEEYERKMDKMNEKIEEYKGTINFLKKSKEETDKELEKRRRSEINYHKLEGKVNDYKYELEHKVY